MTLNSLDFDLRESASVEITLLHAFLGSHGAAGGEILRAWQAARWGAARAGSCCAVAGVAFVGPWAPAGRQLPRQAALQDLGGVWRLSGLERATALGSKGTSVLAISTEQPWLPLPAAELEKEQKDLKGCTIPCGMGGSVGQDELQCTYAALVLHDDGAEITPAAMTDLIKAAGCSVEGYWPLLMVGHVY